jgi:hypothetical protein
LNAFVAPLAAGFAVAAVIALSALYQRYQFRRNGDPPVFGPRHVFTYGMSTALSGAIGEVWNPPFWQKLLVFCVVFGVAWMALKVLGKRRSR